MNRKRIATQLLTLIAVAVLAGLAIAQSGSGTRTAPAKQDASAATEGKAPKVIAVYFHADWCGYCKQLSDKFGDLRTKFDEAEVLYVKLDQTTQSDRRQAAYMAHALGMESAWAEHGGKTGFVLFVDGETRRVIERSAHDESLAQIGNTLQGAVRRAS